jgi:hypothetical protein
MGQPRYPSYLSPRSSSRSWAHREPAPHGEPAV